MDKNNYDLIASFYVFIRKIVLGEKTERAYSYYLNYVKPGDRILIVGGGAGKILKDSHLSNTSLEIDYVDISPKMIKIAGKQKYLPKVNFICENILSYAPNCEYDVIILPFVLDVFDEINLIKTISSVKKWTKEGGIVIVSDFAPPVKLSQKILLRLMFIFFKITTNIESGKLFKIESYFDSTALKKISRVDFSEGFIFSAVYKNIQVTEVF